MDLATSLRLTLQGVATKTGDLSGGPTARPTISLTDTLADGTGVDQADIVYYDSGSMGAGGTLSVDLNVIGGITDVYGDDVAGQRVKALCWKNTSTNPAIHMVGGGTGGNGTNAWDTWISSTGQGGGASGAGAVYVRAGGVFFLWAPDATAYAVTTGTVDILVITEMATQVDAYEMFIVMASA